MKCVAKMIFFAAVMSAAVCSCQKQEFLLVDPDAPAPSVTSVVLDRQTLVYGDSLICEITVSDASAISHAEVRFTIDNAVHFSNVHPGYNATELVFRDTVSVPFAAMCKDVTGKLEVTVMNKKMKTASMTKEVQVERPDFGSLWFIPSGTSSGQQPVELKKVSDGTGYAYVAEDVKYENGVTGFISSTSDASEGFRWGFDSSLGICSLDSEEPVTLYDSESTDMRVREITFDALSFEVGPLKKERSVEGVELLPYKKNPSDADYVSNTFRSVSAISLTQNQEVALELIDTEEILFDPDWFSLNDGKLVYTGESGDVTLYLNTLYNFVFVEHESWPFVSDKPYPETLLVNGWGIACPELWNYNPNWNFPSALSMRRTGENTYRMTVTASVDANFKLYTGTDWGYEVNPQEITYGSGVLESREEDGKPGNYNIYFKSGQTFKSCVMTITVAMDSDGKATLDSEVLRTSDKDK